MSDDLIGVEVKVGATRVTLPRKVRVSDVDAAEMEVTLWHANGIRIVLPLATSVELAQWKAGQEIELAVPPEPVCEECRACLDRGGHLPHCSQHQHPKGSK